MNNQCLSFYQDFKGIKNGIKMLVSSSSVLGLLLLKILAELHIHWEHGGDKRNGFLDFGGLDEYSVAVSGIKSLNVWFQPSFFLFFPLLSISKL